MPFTRALTASLFISLLLFHLSYANQMMGISEAPSPAPQAPIIDCGEACKGRCKLSSRPNLCKRACGSCCAKCKCVPPGTSGNYEACPCYFTLTTRDGHRKCP